MIEYTMLILLGICIGGLVAFLFAPSVWHRAVRLTTRRLEATMPMSLSEIEADKDLLRASYAVKIRRLEAGLNSARDKSANQLVEISRHQMEIAELRRETMKLKSDLEERRNAAAVFETTIRKRLPELEQLVASANSALEERAANLEDLQQKLERREEILKQTQRSAAFQQEELGRLRAALERQGQDRSGRFKRRPTEWGLDEYRSEYDRLNLEMSRMREQLARASELETQHISVLKREMQQLAEQIIASASLRDDSTDRDWREHEVQIRRQERPQPPQRQPQAPRGQHHTPLVTAKPWPGNAQKEPAPTVIAPPPKPDTNTATATPVPAPAQPATVASPKETPPTAEIKADESAMKPAAAQPAAAAGPKETRPAIEVSVDEPVTKPVVRPNLSSLLADAVKNDAVETRAAEAVTVTPAESKDENAAANAGQAEENSANAMFDQVFREILDGSSSAATEKTAEPASSEAEKPELQKSEASDDKPAESSTMTLVDRLRLVQERQTG